MKKSGRPFSFGLFLPTRALTFTRVLCTFLSPVGPDQVVQLVFPKQDKRCLLAAQGNEQIELAERNKRVDQVYEKIKQAHKRTVIKGKRMKSIQRLYTLICWQATAAAISGEAPGRNALQKMSRWQCKAKFRTSSCLLLL
jgi:hypothetical protein